MSIFDVFVQNPPLVRLYYVNETPSGRTAARLAPQPH
jgi:hypothetical protein